MSALILSPHVDDEVLGCSAFLRPGTHAVFGGVESREGMPASLRTAELEASAAGLGFACEQDIDSIRLSVATPIPGTPLYALADAPPGLAAPAVEVPRAARCGAGRAGARQARASAVPARDRDSSVVGCGGCQKTLRH